LVTVPYTGEKKLIFQNYYKNSTKRLKLKKRFQESFLLVRCLSKKNKEDFVNFFTTYETTFIEKKKNDVKQEDLLINLNISNHYSIWNKVYNLKIKKGIHSAKKTFFFDQNHMVYLPLEPLLLGEKPMYNHFMHMFQMFNKKKQYYMLGAVVVNGNNSFIVPMSVLSQLAVNRNQQLITGGFSCFEILDLSSILFFCHDFIINRVDDVLPQ